MKFLEFFRSLEWTKKTNVLTVAFLVGILALTVTIAQQRTSYRQKAAETPGNVTLTFSPASATIPVGQPLSVDLILKAGSNNITGADVTVSFNTEVLSISQFTPTGQFNSELVKTIDANAGTFHYAVTNTDLTSQISGDIKLGTFVLQPKAAGQANVSLSVSQIVASNSTESLSVSPQNGSYIVEVSQTPSPTMSLPTVTPTNTPVPPTPTPAVPKITSIEPLQAIPGARIVIRGENFLLPETSASSYKVLLVHVDNSTTTLTSLLDAATNPNNPDPLWTQTSISFTLGNLPPQLGMITVTAGNLSASFPEKFTILSVPTATPMPTNTPVPPTVTPTPTVVPTNTPIPPTPTRVQIMGDANGDNIVDILDYNIWRDEYLGTLTTKTSDFNNDDKVDLLDFNIWRSALASTSPTLTPTVIPTSTPVVPTRTPTPSFTPTSSPTLTPSPSILQPSSSYKRVFKTSAEIRSYSGNLVVEANSLPGEQVHVNEGLKAADKICQHRANSRNLGGTWKAWLSSSQTSAASRLTHASVPYKRLDGVTIANNWSDLTDGNLQAAIKITEFGIRSTDAGVWTNTLANGNSKYTDTFMTCSDWSTSQGCQIINGRQYCPYNGSQGSDFSTNNEWTDYSGSACSYADGLYCFEQ